MNPTCPASAASPRRARHVRVVALLALATSTLAVSATRARAAAPPVELAESRPIESTLGNLALPTALGTWVRLIGGARHSLDIEQFYVSTWPHEPMDDVMLALGEAAKRGVRIRLVLDRGMYRTYPGSPTR